MLEGVLSKFRGITYEGLPLETQSTLKNIFTQFDQYKVSGIIQ